MMYYFLEYLITVYAIETDGGKSKRSRTVEDKDSKKRHKSDKPTKHYSDKGLLTFIFYFQELLVLIIIQILRF